MGRLCSECWREYPDDDDREYCVEGTLLECGGVILPKKNRQESKHSANIHAKESKSEKNEF